MTRYLVTGRHPARDDECVVCEEWVDAGRPWEAVLLREARRGPWAAAHAHCLGGKFGGVQTCWRGPAAITVDRPPPPSSPPVHRGDPGPLVGLSLEVIGDDMNALMRGRGLSPWNPVWVAEVVGPDPLYGLARRFLAARKDYTQANSVGSRGVWMHFALRRGCVYEVRSHPTQKGCRRYFVRVTAEGERVEMSRAEVLAWLAERSA